MSEAETAKSEVRKLKESLADREADLKAVIEKVEYILMRLPNLPYDKCPVGTSEADNPLLRTEQYDESRWQGRKLLPHWELATNAGIFDAKRASKISGNMFALLRGRGADLLQAMVRFAIDLNRDRYELILPPHMVSTKTFTATGHLPKFEQDAYKFRDDDLWAIPTAEVPLMSMHREEILDPQELPIRYMAYTTCFRREAGAAGRDTRGMQRLHEFHKVELLILCSEENVEREFEGLLADAERPLKLLGVPYRVVELCTGDLTFASSKMYDIEVYAPAVDRWLEVSSVGIFTDFQARRGNVRVYTDSGKTTFVHSMNGSAMATPRLWAALLELFQEDDGSVRIPEVLQKYTGFDRITPKE